MPGRTAPTSVATNPADTAVRWSKLELPERRGLRRLTQFTGPFPVDAVLGLSALDADALERILASGALMPNEHGFVLEPAIAQLARAMTVTTEDAAGDARAFGRWLLDHVVAIERSTGDTALAFDRIEPLVPEVRAAVGRLRIPEPELAAALWCAISELLFYRRTLPFDCPEYEVAIACADEAGAHELRVHTRIVAGRAIIEVKSPSHARRWFEEARDLAVTHGLDDWRGDAVRGLGWVLLAEGDLEGAKEHFSLADALHRATQHMRGVADACMALGVVSVLLGRMDEAGRQFFRAEAILCARQDTVRLAKLGSLRKTLGLGDRIIRSADFQREKERDKEKENAVDLHGLVARGQYWRAALLLVRSEEPDATSRAQVLAELAGVSWKELVAAAQAPALIPEDLKNANDVGAATTNPTWELRADGKRRMLVAPDGATHDLTRRGPFVKLLAALAASETPLSANALFEVAWPGENVRHESALLRVYTTVRRLRNLGVPIATSGDGYFCDRLRSML